jgi:hypothetical protein
MEFDHCGSEAGRAGSTSGARARGLAVPRGHGGTARAVRRAPTGRGRLRPAGARPVWGCDVLVKDEAAAAGPCCGRGAGRTRGVGHREKPAVELGHANGGRTRARNEKGASVWRAHTDTKRKLVGVNTGGI